MLPQFYAGFSLCLFSSRISSVLFHFTFFSISIPLVSVRLFSISLLSHTLTLTVSVFSTICSVEFIFLETFLVNMLLIFNLLKSVLIIKDKSLSIFSSQGKNVLLFFFPHSMKYLMCGKLNISTDSKNNIFSDSSFLRLK